MGLFIDTRKLRRLNEVETQDGQPIDPEDAGNPPADYTAEAPTEGDQTPPEDTNNQPPQEGEQPADDQQGQEPPVEGEEPPVDYTDMEDDGGDGAPPPDNGGGAPPADQPESEVDELKKQEEDLYNELSPEQLDIKHKELKSRYLDMYDMVVAVIERIGDAAVSEENIGTIEYVSNTLSQLKDMIVDYTNDVYKTKSYIENSINYNRFLAVLNGINKILEEMNAKN